MPFKRITAAVLLLLAVVYCRFLMPSFYKDMIPAVRAAIDEEQVALTLPDEIDTWLSLD